MKFTVSPLRTFLTLYFAICLIILTSGAIQGVQADPIFKDLATGSLSNIQGATLDTTRGELIVFGDDNPNLPPIDNSDLLVALRTRFDHHALPEQQWPGVTIEFSPTNQLVQDVTYFGDVHNTRFGFVLFEADRLLKIYSLGYDNKTGVAIPIASQVPGYQSELDCLAARQENPPPNIQWRKWFSPTLTIDQSPDRSTIQFTQSRITLNWAYYNSSSTSAVVSACAQAFVDHFNAHYDEFAAEQQARGNTVLLELKQISRMVAIAEWLREWNDGRIPGLNPSWLKTVPVPAYTTPLTTPLINPSSGLLQISGGVDLAFDLSRFTINPATTAVGTSIRQSRPPQLEPPYEWPCPRSIVAPSEEQACSRAVSLAVLMGPDEITLNERAFLNSQLYRQHPTFILEDQGNIEFLLEEFERFEREHQTLFYGVAYLPNSTAQRQWNISHRTVQLARAAKTVTEDALEVWLVPQNGSPILLDRFTEADQQGVWVPGPILDLSIYRGQPARIRVTASLRLDSQAVFLIGGIEQNASFVPDTMVPTDTATVTPSTTPTETHSVTPTGTAPTMTVTATLTPCSTPEILPGPTLTPVTGEPSNSAYLPLVVRNC